MTYMKTIFTDAAKARQYIKDFEHLSPKFKGMTYVTFPSGTIHFNKMNNREAIKVANGLIELKAEAFKTK